MSGEPDKQLEHFQEGYVAHATTDPDRFRRPHRPQVNKALHRNNRRCRRQQRRSERCRITANWSTTVP